MKRYQMLIGGEWVDAEARGTFETENPYLGAAWAFVPRAKDADVDRAVDAALKAFRAPSWLDADGPARSALPRGLSRDSAPRGGRLQRPQAKRSARARPRRSKPLSTISIAARTWAP